MDVQAAIGAATGAVRMEAAATAPARNFDYFPGHYLNRATKIEEAVPTF